MTETTRQHGFTLTEVIVVMVIIGILTAITAPAIMATLPGIRLRSSARDVFSVMTRAKSEAISRGERVTVLFNPPGRPEAYIMFLDNGAGGGTAGNEEIDGDESRLLSSPGLPHRVVFDPSFGDGDGVSFANNALVFTERGLPAGAGGGLGGGTVQLCTTDLQGRTTDRCRSIVVSSAGRITMQ